MDRALSMHVDVQHRTILWSVPRLVLPHLSHHLRNNLVTSFSRYPRPGDASLFTGNQTVLRTMLPITEGAFKGPRRFPMVKHTDKHKKSRRVRQSHLTSWFPRHTQYSASDHMISWENATTNDLRAQVEPEQTVRLPIDFSRTHKIQCM